MRSPPCHSVYTASALPAPPPVLPLHQSDISPHHLHHPTSSVDTSQSTRCSRPPACALTIFVCSKPVLISLLFIPPSYQASVFHYSILCPAPIILSLSVSLQVNICCHNLSLPYSCYTVLSPSPFTKTLFVLFFPLPCSNFGAYKYFIRVWTVRIMIYYCAIYPFCAISS